MCHDAVLILSWNANAHAHAHPAFLSNTGYLNAIRSVQPPSKWKILVVDSYTKTLLNSVLKMYDILQQNVSIVENIESQRAPQSTFEAAYLLCPTSQNVERIIRDLAPEQGRAPQYAAGHIFFVDGECKRFPLYILLS